MSYHVYNYLEGTHSVVLTRGVVIGFHHRRPNHGCTLLTQAEFKQLLTAFEVVL